MYQLQKKWKQLLTKHKLDRPQLLAHSIANFQLLVDSVCQKLTSLIYKHSKESIPDAFDQLMMLINSSVGHMAVGCVVKKLALMHGIVNRMQNKQLVEIIVPNIHKQINAILKDDVLAIVQDEPKRREDSITKIKDFVRKLSGSKERSRSKGKMGIEQQKEKGAVGQVISKIITPFCLYMMKIVDDFESFWKIKHSSQIEKILIWKMVNWTKLLGQLILQVNRLGLYFKEDMLSVSVYLNYLISVDMSKYYDVLKHYIMKESQRWRGLIEKVDKIQSKESKWRENSELCELKELILQWKGIKQKLHYIHGSGLMLKFVQYFPKPEQFTLSATNIKEQEIINFILDFLEQKKRNKSISRSTSRHSSWLDGDCQLSEQTRQSALSSQQSKENAQLFCRVSENVFANKLQGFNFGRSRLRKLQQFQKQKFIDYLQGC